MDIIAAGSKPTLESKAPCATCVVRQGTIFGAAGFIGCSKEFGEFNRWGRIRRSRSFVQTNINAPFVPVGMGTPPPKDELGITKLADLRGLDMGCFGGAVRFIDTLRNIW